LAEIDSSGARPVFKFCSLGSGSKGNASIISAGDTLLLVDCGFSVKETLRRLESKFISPSDISAILVTHEHSDHIKGVASFSSRYSVPVWFSRGTSLHKSCEKIKYPNVFNSHTPFELGSIKITPVPVPHDSREATQFIFSVDDASLGLLTDVGHITEHIRQAYSQCDAMMLEFNYDHQMLMQGKYPRALKQRVSGGLGHLSNEQAIDFLLSKNMNALDKLVVMHCSQENNAETIIVELLKQKGVVESTSCLIADQSHGFDWQTLTVLPAQNH